MSRFAAVVVLAILGMLLYWFADAGRLENVSVIFSGLFSDQAAIDQKRFRTAALKEVNHIRGQLKLTPLSNDSELEKALYYFANSQSNPSDISLDTLFGILRDRFPGAQFLSATLLFDPQESGLLSDLQSWEETLKGDYESIATYVFRDRMQHGCLAVLTKRLPSFDLGLANRDGGRFFNQCPRCGKNHAIELDQRSRTLILSCPDCGRPYDVLAADVSGEFRRAPDFLGGDFRPPSAPYAISRDPRKRLREIWAGVLKRCEYEYDTKSMRRGEAWKTPAQTWHDCAGDCEDTAILLANILISTGFDARVAVGWNVHVGQHAWTVARIGGEQYVLESTIQFQPGDELPALVSVDESADEYRPEQLFDKEQLYFRENGDAGPQPCHDYWAVRDWPAVRQPIGTESISRSN